MDGSNAWKWHSSGGWWSSMEPWSDEWRSTTVHGSGETGNTDGDEAPGNVEDTHAWPDHEHQTSKNVAKLPQQVEQSTLSQTGVLKDWPAVEMGETFWDWMDKVNGLTWKGG
jgi:hypothetical protein